MDEMRESCRAMCVAICAQLVVSLSAAAPDWPGVTPRVHCANADGGFIGLASDGAYTLRLPADAPGNPEKWMRVRNSGSDPRGAHVPAMGTYVTPINGSFTGEYVQVLPDDRSQYKDIYGIGSFSMTGLDFELKVTAAGLHTLFLRWTGGDAVGGGDSLYVVMRDAQTDALIPGRSTFKKKLVPVDKAPGIAGCCYDHVTHQCHCFNSEQPTPDQVAGATCKVWVPALRAKNYGIMCEAGNGEMVAVTDPKWYLYAGQDSGNVMDFDSEPWDATCEAEGIGTRDTGLDFAAWDLLEGSYRLVIYPREDGTALDAFYLAGPETPPPTGLRLSAGDSTVDCGSAVEAPTPIGSGITHGLSDAKGWGSRVNRRDSPFGGTAGASCGMCLVPIAPEECPDVETLEAMGNCDSVLPGGLCEADGECGTTEMLNNCNHHNARRLQRDGGRPRGSEPPLRERETRQNDVYRRLSPEECAGLSEESGLSGFVIALIVLIVFGVLGVATYCVCTRNAAVAASATAIRKKIQFKLMGAAHVSGARVTAPLSSTTTVLPVISPMAATAQETGANSQYVRRDDLQHSVVGGASVM